MSVFYFNFIENEKFMKNLLLLFVFIVGTTSLMAQNLKRSPVGERVQFLKSKGELFEPAILFDQLPVTSDKSSLLMSEVVDFQLFNPKRKSLRSIVESPPVTLSLYLPVENGADLELELYRVNMGSLDFVISTASKGEVDAANFSAAHYRGIVKGKPHSLVALSIFEEEVMSMISTNENTFVLGKLKGTNNDLVHLLYKESDLTNGSDFSCATEDDGLGYSPEQLLAPVNYEKNTGDCTNFYIEVGDDIYNDKGDVTGVVNYVTGLFNQVAVLYNDLDGSAGAGSVGVQVGISEIFIWDISDPYSGSGSSANLSTFKNQHGTFNGDLGIFLNYDISGGVAAGFNGLCNGNPDESMCVAGISSSYSSVPTYSWSVMVCTHELGHLFGSRHTHACVWNGDNTAIDGCQRTEGNCRKPAIPSDGGLVMSYCHLKNVGINFTKSFGDQPGNVVLNSVANASCLGVSCASTVTNTAGNGGDPCFNGVQDAGEDGVDCGGVCAATCGGTGSCDAPSQVNTTGITNRNATMNWTTVSGASSYDVQLRQVGTSSWQSFSATTNSLSLQGFKRNKTYEWQVRAICSGTPSAYSASCNFTAGGGSTQSCGNNLVASAEGTISWYPNPAKNNLILSTNFPESSNVQVRLVDMTGRTVHSASSKEGINSFNLNVSSLVSGIYLLHIDNGVNVFTEKIIIQ